jgi:hypothetical protein
LANGKLKHVFIFCFAAVSRLERVISAAPGKRHGFSDRLLRSTFRSNLALI